MINEMHLQLLRINVITKVWGEALDIFLGKEGFKILFIWNHNKYETLRRYWFVDNLERLNYSTVFESNRDTFI